MNSASLRYNWAPSIMVGLVVLPVYLLGWGSDTNALVYFLLLDAFLYSPVLLGQVADLVSSE